MSAFQLQSIRSSGDTFILQLKSYSKEFAAATVHAYVSLNETFLDAYRAYKTSDFLKCSDILMKVKDSEIVQGLSHMVNIAETQVGALFSFLKKRLGPFLELVFGANLTAIPYWGTAAIGSLLGVGPFLAAVLCVLIVLAGIMVMFHATNALERIA